MKIDDLADRQFTRQAHISAIARENNALPAIFRRRDASRSCRFRAAL